VLRRTPGGRGPVRLYFFRRLVAECARHLQFLFCCTHYTYFMIGIFDSGSGGLSVLRAIRARAPQADIVYFGDLKNAPYGNRTREELGVLTAVGIQKLLDMGATEIVSGCNSVSVSIVPSTLDALRLPRTNLVEMVEPTVSSFRTQSARVLVCATQATIDSCMYQQGLGTVGATATGVALPTLVTLIESGAERQELIDSVYSTLTPYVGLGYTHLLLGCTHYPLVHDVFDMVCEELLPGISIVDPAYAVARAVVTQFDVRGQGKTAWVLSQQSSVFERFASSLGYTRAALQLVV